MFSEIKQREGFAKSKTEKAIIAIIVIAIVFILFVFLRSSFKLSDEMNSMNPS
jgi:uncharacterized protein HemY